MATVRSRKNILYIQWYDAIEKKVTCRSTHLNDTEANRKKAEQLAKKLQAELSNRNTISKQLGIKRITIKEAFQHFLRNNQQKHSHTIYEYHRFYELFTEYFDDNLACSSITKLKVEDWLNNVKMLKYKKNTIHIYGKQCVHFLNFLFEYDYLPMFRINKDVKTKPEIGEKIVFTDEDIIKIFDNLQKKNSNFRTAVQLAFYTGLRSSDFLSITVERINLEQRELTYFSPKRGKFRSIPFHEELVPVLESRINEVKTGSILDYANIHSLGRAVERYLDKLQIGSKGYSTRTFRKTFITLCRSRFNMDASIVRELVGHEHGNTTDKYYNQIGMEAMKKELQKFKRPGAAE